MTKTPKVVLLARNEEIADLVQQCVDGKIRFSGGQDSLCAKFTQMGYSCVSAYEMVNAAFQSKRVDKS